LPSRVVLGTWLFSCDGLVFPCKESSINHGSVCGNFHVVQNWGFKASSVRTWGSYHIGT
jgi:hypothetical protein